MNDQILNTTDTTAMPKFSVPVSVAITHQLEYDKLRNMALLVVLAFFGAKLLLMLIAYVLNSGK